MPDQMVHPRPPESAADLRRARTDHGLSHRALAKAAGVSRGVVREAESGRRPQPSNARRLANYFGVQVSDLWPEPDNQNGPAALDKPGTMTDVHQEDDSAHER